MINRKTLFKGNDETDQLFAIFKILGTPTDENYPGWTTLPDYKQTFSKFPPLSFNKIFPSSHIESDGIDIIQKCLLYNPKERISAKDAILHPYFKTEFVVSSN